MTKYAGNKLPLGKGISRLRERATRGEDTKWEAARNCIWATRERYKVRSKGRKGKTARSLGLVLEPGILTAAPLTSWAG